MDIAALARGEYLRTHFKNMREVAAALTGQYTSFYQPFVPVMVFSTLSYNDTYPPPLSIPFIDIVLMVGYENP